MTVSGRRTKVGETSLGWIGTGRMGQAMIPRLLAAGHAVHIWSRVEHESEHLAKGGATVVKSKQALARCDVIFTMVSTTDDLKEILFGESGLIGKGARLNLVVDSSSISLEGSFEIRQRLEAAGVDYLSAPVSGNPQVTTAGKLLIVASGPKASYQWVEPYLKAIGGEAIWVGEGEIARVWKIAHNTLLGVITQGLCEVTVLAEKTGIPRHLFLESINKSVLGSLFTRYKTPTLTNLTFDQVTFTPRLLLKDMDLGLAAARAHGVPMPAAAASRESVARLIGRQRGDVDFAALIIEVARDAGLELRSEAQQIGDGLDPV